MDECLSAQKELPNRLASSTPLMQRVIYPDRWLISAGAPILGLMLRHMGEPMSVVELLQDPGYYGNALFYIGEVLAVWILNRRLIQWLDAQYDWVSKALPRFFIQAVSAYSITALLVVMLSFVYYDVLVPRPAPFDITNIFSADIPTCLLFVTLIHMGYTGMWMLEYHRCTVRRVRQRIAEAAVLMPVHAEAPPSDPKRDFRKTLLVNQGKGIVPLATEQVAYIFISNEVSIVKTAEGLSFTIDATLEQLTEQLDPSKFFRVSRQFIVHRPTIQRVEKEGTGRLLLYLEPAYSEEVAVSRRRASEFRQWMNG